jgi:hypothetical protein
VVPHRTLLEAMTRAHVFVFPSIVEGFGMVITEALAAGLPVITTPHTAGPDILTEGHDGFIVPIRDPDAIAERITRLADDEGAAGSDGGECAQNGGALGWSTYEAGVPALGRSGSRRELHLSVRERDVGRSGATRPGGGSSCARCSSSTSSRFSRGRCASGSCRGWPGR